MPGVDPRNVGADAARVVFAAILCLIVPFTVLYSLFAVGALGLILGLVPLAGAVWLLATASWPVGARAAVSVTAVVGTVVYSVIFISHALAGLGS